MDKLVVYKDGEVINEIVLDKSEISLGRGPDCDIHLNDISVSRHHSSLLKIQSDYFVEDLESTNGTLLNNQPVKKHILKHEDVLAVGTFKLQFIREVPEAREEADPEKTVVLQVVGKSDKGGKTEAEPARSLAPKIATVKFFRGPNKGHSDEIKRSLYTIGQPGEAVAAIARRPQGFYLLHIGGDNYPKINDQEIEAAGGVQLHEGDLVEVGENLAEISFG
ncbi:MAG: FHA domain-containing protein [Sedimenticola sp.]